METGFFYGQAGPLLRAFFGNVPGYPIPVSLGPEIILTLPHHPATQTHIQLKYSTTHQQERTAGMQSERLATTKPITGILLTVENTYTGRQEDFTWAASGNSAPPRRVYPSDNAQIPWFFRRDTIATTEGQYREDAARYRFASCLRFSSYVRYRLSTG